MESREPVCMVLGPKDFEEAVKWFKNFKPKDDNSRDFAENIPVRLPENPAQKSWDKIHSEPIDLSHLTDVNYWKDEMQKCLDSEEYFYNNYMLINGNKPEPVKEGYFKTLRTIKARRKPSKYIPAVNELEIVQELVFRRFVNLINIDYHGKE